MGATVQIEQNIEVRRGDYEEFGVVATDLDGDVQDITGASIKFTAKENLTDTDEDAVIALSSANVDEIAITDAENGAFSVYIAEETTTTLDIRSYYYDIQLTLGGNPKTIAYGILTVQPDVTRDV